MASTAVPAGANSSASHPTGPSRTGWGSTVEPGSAFRGMGRGGGGAPRGRSGRGGHRGTRSVNARGGAASNIDSAKKSPQDLPPKDKAPSVSHKAAAAPASSNPPSSSAQTNGANKPSSRPKVARKASDSKTPRKLSLGLDTAAPPAPNTTSSTTQPSPRTPRRRRSHASSKASLAPPASIPAPSLPSKPTLTMDSNTSQPAASKPTPAAVKDLPPHLVPPHSAHAPTFDIRHDIDALVERVRSVAMDRPHTPGSHIDWAGEDDDSLPDLDDWGVTSTHTTNLVVDSGKASVISPILQDTLRTLPSIIDIDVPTPSDQSHEAERGQAGAKSVGENTPRSESGEGTSVQASIVNIQADAGTTEPSTVEISAPNPTIDGVVANGTSEPIEPSSAAGSGGSTVHEDLFSPTSIRPQPPQDIFSAESSPSPDRGLAASMHAMSKSLSPPNFLRSPPYNFSQRGTGGRAFQPTHARAQTVGRPDYLSDTDRPRRGDGQTHGRNHSTPPAGSGAAHSHSRPTSRPVITGAAISRLARTLGGTPLAKRETAPVAVAKAN